MGNRGKNNTDNTDDHLFILSFLSSLFRRISDILSESLPNLQSLFLTNNLVQELADLDSLANFKRLEYVSLLGNPVTTRDHYRLYLINKVPQVLLAFLWGGSSGLPSIVDISL